MNKIAIRENIADGKGFLVAFLLGVGYEKQK